MNTKVKINIWPESSCAFVQIECYSTEAGWNQHSFKAHRSFVLSLVQQSVYGQTFHNNWLTKYICTSHRTPCSSTWEIKYTYTHTRARDFQYLSSSGTFQNSRSLCYLRVALREVTLLVVIWSVIKKKGISLSSCKAFLIRRKIVCIIICHLGALRG